jgi:hypothetical protein
MAADGGETSLLAGRQAATLSAMIDWSSCPVVERSAETVSGAWVFRGTRVPVSALFENLEDDARVARAQKFSSFAIFALFVVKNS